MSFCISYVWLFHLQLRARRFDPGAEDLTTAVALCSHRAVLTELRKKLPRLGLEKNRKILIAEFIEQTHDNSYYNIGVDTSLSSQHCEIFIS